MKRIICIAIAIGLIGSMIGCDSDPKDSDRSSSHDKTQATKVKQAHNKYTPPGGATRFEGQGFTEAQVADLLEIEANMTEALIRWSFRDKAALYDNELEYVQDKWSLEEYLNQNRIKAANSADSVVGYYVTGGVFYGRDSVIVDDVIVFIGVAGNRIDFINKDKLYYHRGRWVRPTMGRMNEQLDYERLILQADSAAAAEEEEGY